MKLTINLVTRGRPALLRETIERTLPNLALRDTVFMVSVDHDDAKTIDSLGALPSDRRLLPVVMDREDSMGGKYNRALTYAPADVYLSMVDYAPFVTPRFDEKVLEAAAVFPDNIGVVYNKYCCDAELPSINGITHGLAKFMGFIYPEYFPFSFVDLWLDDVARLIDRVSYVDVVIDRSKRQQTLGRRDTKFWSVLLDLLYGERVACAERIIHSPEFLSPSWQKELLLRKFPLMGFHANNVSRACRADSEWHDRYAAFESQSDADRYERIKGGAKELMRKLVAEAKDSRTALAS